MKIKLLISRAGPGFCLDAGDTMEVSETEGMRLIQQGKAEAIEKREKAVKKKTAEKAVRE